MRHYSIDELNEFRDGESPDELCFEISSHLEACSECQALFLRLSTLGNVFSKAPELNYSEDFLSTVMARVKPEADMEQEPWFGSIFKAWLLPAAQFICALVLLGFQVSGGALREDLTADDSVLLASLDNEFFEESFFTDGFDHSQLLGLEWEEL